MELVQKRIYEKHLLSRRRGLGIGLDIAPEVRLGRTGYQLLTPDRREHRGPRCRPAAARTHRLRSPVPKPRPPLVGHLAATRRTKQAATMQFRRRDDALAARPQTHANVFEKVLIEPSLRLSFVKAPDLPALDARRPPDWCLVQLPDSPLRVQSPPQRERSAGLLDEDIHRRPHLRRFCQHLVNRMPLERLHQPALEGFLLVDAHEGLLRDQVIEARRPLS
jgi:hypothetical protein